MIDDSELEQLLSDLESDRVERKESAADTGKIRQAICAFANDMPGHGNPGVIFIGVKDDSTCAQLTITDQATGRHEVGWEYFAASHDDPPKENATRV